MKQLAGAASHLKLEAATESPIPIPGSVSPASRRRPF
jgi:hypothetical protein